MMKTAPLSTLERLRSRRTADPDLAKSVSEGDLSSLGVLYGRHRDVVRSYIARAIQGGAETDDLAHETFLAFAKIAGKFDGGASARPFLIGIAAHLVRRRRRRVHRRSQAVASFATTFPERPSFSPEDAAGAREQIERLEEAILKLPDEKRRVFLLVARDGLSGEDAARAFCIPVNTVWTRLHHARAELRHALSAATES